MYSEPFARRGPLTRQNFGRMAQAHSLPLNHSMNSRVSRIEACSLDNLICNVLWSLKLTPDFFKIFFVYYFGEELPPLRKSGLNLYSLCNGKNEGIQPELAPLCRGKTRLQVWQIPDRQERNGQLIDLQGHCAKSFNLLYLLLGGIALSLFYWNS